MGIAIQQPSPIAPKHTNSNPRQMHPFAPAIIILIVGLPALVFAIFHSYKNHKRTLAGSVPKSVYIKHYLKYANDDPSWKQDFLTFCKNNNLGISEDDIDNGTLLK
jgi:hypothetical protein